MKCAACMGMHVDMTAYVSMVVRSVMLTGFSGRQHRGQHQ